jgi:hypothetical protein
MKTVFRDHSQPIRLYPSISSDNDPYEHNKTDIELNPITIKAIVTDLAFEKVTWAMPGIVTDNAKQIIIEARNLSILLNSYKIQVGEEYFEGWRISGRLQYKLEGESPYHFIRAYIYRKLV